MEEIIEHTTVNISNKEDQSLPRIQNADNRKVEVQDLVDKKKKLSCAFVGAFQDDDENDRQEDNNLQNNSEEETRRAIAIISVEFPHLTISALIRTLFIRLKSNTLPNLSDDSQLSVIQIETINDKKRPKKKNIELVTIRSEKNNKREYKNKRDTYRRQQQMNQLEQFRLQLQELHLEQLQLEQRPHHESKGSKSHIQKDLQIIGANLDSSQSITIRCVDPSQFHTKQQRMRFTQKRLVAKAFIRKGYGMINFRKELNDTPYVCQFDESRYKTVSYGMVTDTFRKLEQLIEDYCPNFKMEKLQMKPLYSILLNCRDHFPDITPSFLKIMKAQFHVDCNSVNISKKEATKLYSRILYEFKIKDGEIRDVEPKSKRKIQDWKEEISPDDSELLRFYKEERNVSKVRDRFKEEYGSGTEFDDCKVVKSRLNKAFRGAIRKVRAAVNESGDCFKLMSFLNLLNNDRIKKILVSPDAINARIALCEFYCAKTNTSQTIQKAILMMDDAIKTIERRKGGNDNQLDDLDF